MAGRTRAGAIAAVAVTVALVLGAPAVAFADSPTPAPTTTPTSSPAPKVDPRIAALAAQIVALQRTAEAKGEVAQKAGEKSDAAQARSDAAAAQLVEAKAAADAATAKAAETRARASAVAAQLARTNFGTLPLDLMLNGGSAEGVLGGLSTTSQLSVQSQLIFAQARSDELEAERLQTVADSAASDAAWAAKAAKRAYAAAKKDADAAKAAVDLALAQQSTLLAGADPAVCGAVGTAPVAACLPAAGAAPSGNSVGAKVVRFAIAQIGKPYVFGAAGPDSYDCSGLTLAAYASAGVSIGIHSATAQYDLAKQEGDLVPLADAKPGDLLFYTDGGGDMYHVTIVAGDGMMLEAPYPGATVREAPIRTAQLVAQAAHFH